MKRSNKSIIIIYAAALLLLFTALMKGDGRTGRMDVESGSVKKNKVYLISKSTESAFWKSVFSGASAAGTAYNMDLVFEGPENEEDYETQNKMIRDAVEDGADAIIFSAVDYDANAEAIDEAAGKNVKIVVIDSDVNSDKVLCRIGTDNYNAGSMAGRAALESKEKKLNIGIVNFDKKTQNGQEREAGFRDIVLKDDRVTIADTINVNSTIEEAKQGTEQLLDQHPEINLIVTFNEWTSLGVGHAISERGLADDVSVVAFDNNVVSVGMLETGEVDALIVQNPYAMGYLGMETAYQVLNGTTLEKDRIDTETLMVNRENMYHDDCQRILFAFEQSE